LNNITESTPGVSQTCFNGNGDSPRIISWINKVFLGKETAEEDIDYVLETLPEIISRLRKMAPKI